MTWGILDVRLCVMNNDELFNSLNQSFMDSIQLGLVDLGYSPGEAYDFVSSTSMAELLDSGIAKAPEVELEDDPIYGLV
mgnify:CR=1 FL=1